MSKLNKDVMSALENLNDFELLGIGFSITDLDRSNSEDIAFEICRDAMFFNGDASQLIPHLRDAHCMSFEQIQIGINEINQSENCDAFPGWEKYF